ncbi:MAG: tetratricopeptide repeat protein [Candidatus Omnitrophica bacterium]|nr:tetratricopeptide repeat protein [Candidatus Omnitrophota bacterium]
MIYILIILASTAFCYGPIFFPQEADAAKIIFKSGKEITAGIIEKTDSYIKIDFNGNPVYYELKYISRIEEAQKPSEGDCAISESKTDENQKLKEEISVLKELIRQMNSEYNIKLGDLYSQVDHFDDAIKAYENALVFNPNNPDLEYNLGVLFETSKKDTARAVAHYRNYLRLRPDAPDKEEIEKIISFLLNNSSF